MENCGTRRLGPTLGPTKFLGVWGNPPAAGGPKVVFRALLLGSTFHIAARADSEPGVSVLQDDIFYVSIKNESR